MERIQTLTPDLFLDGPTEFLVKTVAELLKAEPHWKTLFGEAIDGYKRMDYPARALPAIRLYNNHFTKEAESWFISGQVTMDVILPPSTRRNELQQIQDTLSAALVQQFRRPSFFEASRAAVPGLNELGKTMDVDKSLGFEWGEQICPLTQITVNFKLDLREWDSYLESQSRTKDDPFEKTLATLTKLGVTIQAMRDDLEKVELAVNFDKKV